MEAIIPGSCRELEETLQEVAGAASMDADLDAHLRTSSVTATTVNFDVLSSAIVPSEPAPPGISDELSTLTSSVEDSEIGQQLTGTVNAFKPTKTQGGPDMLKSILD